MHVWGGLLVPASSSRPAWCGYRRSHQQLQKGTFQKGGNGVAGSGAFAKTGWFWSGNPGGQHHGSPTPLCCLLIGTGAKRLHHGNAKGMGMEMSAAGGSP